MNARPFLLCAAISLLGCSCSTLRPPAPTRASPDSLFEASISRIERAEPASPALLNAQLAYAGYLLSRARGPSCAERLNRAQEEIGSVAASPKTRVMFPAGWGLVADLEYRQHLARAACGSKADRRDDLLAAVEAARRAVGLYRNAFDYHSMVIMQFNTAVGLRRLGDDAAAVAALEAALGMDREYGFRDDASENYELLLTWRGEPAGAAQVAALLRQFPQRRVVLKFRWHATDARITLDRRRTSLVGGLVVHSRATAAFERRITANPGGGWSVSYAHDLTGYAPGVWPSESSSLKTQLFFPPAPFPAVGFKVSGTGDFQDVTDSKAFATRLTARTDRLIRAGARSGPDARDATSDAVEATAMAFSPGIQEAETAEDYQLETAMWIGATLEQGVWYEVSAPLALPGLSRFVVPQRLEFAFTRWVPCTADATARSCAEIVIHATPDQQALGNLLADIRNTVQYDRFVDYAASTDARIVIDPATLFPYTREEQIYWYASLSKRPEDQILESEHFLATTKYRAQ
jgi:hypothetical protein